MISSGEFPVIGDITPGGLRSERMLENFGVTEETWREACVTTPGFAISDGILADAGGALRRWPRRRMPNAGRAPS